MGRSAAWWLLSASSLGEIAVGLAIAVAPGPVTGVLLGAPVAGAGVVTARMAGVAVAALGAAWWTERQGLDRTRLRALAASFVGYNAGIGLLFVAHAWSSERTLPAAWAVAAAHVAVAGSYVLALIGDARFHLD